MDNPATRRFSARQAEFAAIRSFIEAACADMREEERLRILLLVEELFANSVNHGYGGDCDQPVWVTLNVSDEECRLTYEDCAPPHDPFAAAAAVSEALGEERCVGGLGIRLLTEFSSARTYQRRGGRNVIELRVRR